MLYMDYNIPREKMLTNPEGRYDAFMIRCGSRTQL